MRSVVKNVGPSAFRLLSAAGSLSVNICVAYGDSSAGKNPPGTVAPRLRNVAELNSYLPFAFMVMGMPRQ